MNTFGRLVITIMRDGPITTIVGTDNDIPVVIGKIPNLSVMATREALIDAIEGLITAKGGKSPYDNPCAGGCSDPVMHAEGGHDI